MSVTAADVESAVRLTVATLGEARDADWDAKAGPLDWTCWETAEHIADNLFFFAAHLGPATPATDRPVPFAWDRHRPGGPGWSSSPTVPRGRPVWCGSWTRAAGC